MKLQWIVCVALGLSTLAGCGRKDVKPPVSEKEVDDLNMDLDIDAGVDSAPPGAASPATTPPATENPGAANAEPDAAPPAKSDPGAGAAP